jgi:hypothetical protein
VLFDAAGLMPRKARSPTSTPPPPGQTAGANGEEKKPAKPQPPSKEELRGWINEVYAGLGGSDETVEEAKRPCRRCAFPAVERLAMIVTGSSGRRRRR